LKAVFYIEESGYTWTLAVHLYMHTGHWRICTLKAKNIDAIQGNRWRAILTRLDARQNGTPFGSRD
jgi:hypothetical protein